MKKSLAVIPFMLLLAVVSCVTINIYFPAAAAEKAADKIIKDIQQGAEAPPEPQSWLLWQQRRLPLAALFSAGISSAHAAADIQVDSPEIRSIRASMKQRFPHLKTYLDQGWVGYTNNGLVAVVDPGKIPLRNRASVEQVVKAENRDRLALYQAIARANGHPEWTDEIQQTFAKRWIANANPGWLVQTAGGAWQKK